MLSKGGEGGEGRGGVDRRSGGSCWPRPPSPHPLANPPSGVQHADLTPHEADGNRGKAQPWPHRPKHGVCHLF